MKLSERWSKLSKIDKKLLLLRIGLPVACLTSVLGLTKCNPNRNNPKDTLIARGKLVLVDVEDENKNIKIKDNNGKILNYKFDENTKAVLSPRDLDISNIKSYQTMLFDKEGNITFGYIEGKYLNSTIIDSIDASNLDFSIYNINNVDGVELYTKDGKEPSTVISDNSQVLCAKTEDNLFRVISIKEDSFVTTLVNSDELDYYSDEYVVDEQPRVVEEYYITSVDLNVRPSYDITSNEVCVLPIGTKVKRVNGVDIYSDGIYEWMNISYLNPNTNQEETGWVAKSNSLTNEDYLVNERTFSNMDLSKSIISESAISVDVNTGQILFDKDAFSQKYPASITKVLTAYLVFKYGNIDDYIEYTDRSVSVEGHKAEGYSTYFPEIVQVGNKISVRDALHISLLKSDNSTTVALAEYVENITGRNFSELMNEEAFNMGCKKCNFTNAYGYEDINHHVSALDMAKITSYIYNNQREVIDIMGTRNYTVYFNNQEFDLDNDSIIFDINEYAVGSKTGYTDAAGQTMISVFEKDGNVIVTVTLNGNGIDSKNLDADLLARSSFEKLESTNENTKVKVLN